MVWPHRWILIKQGWVSANTILIVDEVAKGHTLFFSQIKFSLAREFSQMIFSLAKVKD